MLGMNHPTQGMLLAEGMPGGIDGPPDPFVGPQQPSQGFDFGNPMLLMGLSLLANPKDPQRGLLAGAQMSSMFQRDKIMQERMEQQRQQQQAAQTAANEQLLAKSQWGRAQGLTNEQIGLLSTGAANVSDFMQKPQELPSSVQEAQWYAANAQTPEGKAWAQYNQPQPAASITVGDMYPFKHGPNATTRWQTPENPAASNWAVQPIEGAAESRPAAIDAKKAKTDALGDINRLRVQVKTHGTEHLPGPIKSSMAFNYENVKTAIGKLTDAGIIQASEAERFERMLPDPTSVWTWNAESVEAALDELEGAINRRIGGDSSQDFPDPQKPVLFNRSTGERLDIPE